MVGYRRWNHHDYEGWGYYLITFSTEPRRPIFSRIENYQAELTPSGEALKAAWLKMAEECPQISLREYAIMGFGRRRDVRHLPRIYGGEPSPIVVSRRADESALRAQA